MISVGLCGEMFSSSVTLIKNCAHEDVDCYLIQLGSGTPLQLYAVDKFILKLIEPR